MALTERPAQRLAGRYWQGTHAQAAAGAIHPLLVEAAGWAGASQGLWRSPIVGLSWADAGQQGFRYFVGVADGDGLPAELERLDLPEMEFLSSWHGPQDGDVAAHYGRMFQSLGDAGLEWSRATFDQREEYPPDFHPAAPLSLRLLVPVRVSALT